MSYYMVIKFQTVETRFAKIGQTLKNEFEVFLIKFEKRKERNFYSDKENCKFKALFF
jgi:hypothetical protein